MPLTSFGIDLNDTPILDLPVSHSDMLGISISQQPVPGMVSFYEEHMSRSDAGYTIQEWYNLNGRERASEVALARIKNAIEYHKMKEQERASKRKQ